MTDGTGEFDGAGEGSEGAGDGRAAGDGDAAGPRVVSAWTDGKRTCEACGERVRRTWVADGERTCVDCRSW